MISLYIPKNEATAEQPLIIPEEAIRLRILANSNGREDQAIKHHVRDVVNEEIATWVEQLTSIEEARSLIQSRLPEIQRLAEKAVSEMGGDQAVDVEFGKVQFPTKLYGNFLYPAGEYEAILITLGEGEGANWWCVLFPPLCFLDFSNGVAVSEGFEDEETEGDEKTEEDEIEVENDEEEEMKEEGEEPLFVEEEPVEVKFFVIELFESFFN